MRKLNPGDSVDCRIWANTIVNPYDKYDEIKTFKIIALDQYGYFLYVPSYFILKNTIKIDYYQCKNLNLDDKFLNEYFVHIPANLIFRVNEKLDGMYCCNCNDFCRMAEPNQENGTLICYSCRTNKYY